MTMRTLVWREKSVDLSLQIGFDQYDTKLIWQNWTVSKDHLYHFILPYVNIGGYI